MEPGGSLEQPARRQTQLAGDLAGDQLGLVEPAPSATRTT